MKRIATILLCSTALALAACSSAPKRPEPSGPNGQVLVELLGKPKEGVGEAKTGEVREDYSTSRESVEKGAAFERVNYDSIADIVVIARRNGVEPSGPFNLNQPGVIPELVVNDEGFDHQQLVSVLHGTGAATAKIAVRNKTDAELVVFGFSTEDGFDLVIPAGERKEGSVKTAGVYEIYSETHEFAVCVWHVTGSDDVWFGQSDHGAFLDQLTPGDYTVTVYPPRLPEWSHSLTVTAGKRETLQALLTVNILHKCGH